MRTHLCTFVHQIITSDKQSQRSQRRHNGHKGPYAKPFSMNINNS